MQYKYTRDSGTGIVPGQHNNLIAVFPQISYAYRVLYFGH